MQTWQKRVSDRNWAECWVAHGRTGTSRLVVTSTALWEPVHLSSLLDDRCRVLSGRFNILLCNLVEKLEINQHADGS